jgi:hypothetical protein
VAAALVDTRRDGWLERIGAYRGDGELGEFAELPGV